VLRFALAQTAAWLTRGWAHGDLAEGRLARTDSPLGSLRYALPPVSFDGGPTDWARPPGRWGTDEAAWPARD
ncbi:hypothetical protein G3I40_30390, partial [Streptomyces sp. SID14478]|nr:hypothetical protein [Streptomyces sp. SID14478]